MSDEANFNMVDVSSSLLSQVGFNAETHQGRCVFAKNGAMYEYDGCTEDEFSQIVNSPSAGETFYALWRNSGKPYRRIS